MAINNSSQSSHITSSQSCQEAYQSLAQDYKDLSNLSVTSSAITAAISVSVAIFAISESNKKNR
jgi:hypothetical protein